jgi:hypothetical protein
MVSFRDRATLETASSVGNGAADERPSMFNEVEVGVLMPSLFIMEDDDSGAVWTANVESCDSELSGTLVRVPTELAVADAVFCSAVADDEMPLAASEVGSL